MRVRWIDLPSERRVPSCWLKTVSSERRKRWIAAFPEFCSRRQLALKTDRERLYSAASHKDYSNIYRLLETKGKIGNKGRNWQPSRQDIMRALNVSAKHRCPRLTFVPNLAYHVQIMCLSPFTSGGGRGGGGVFYSQQRRQTADQSSSHTTRYF